MCRLLKKDKTRTTPFHPSSYGRVETFNSTLVNMIDISAYVNDDQSDWDVHLPFLTAAYSSCEHISTGYSPNRLMLGREVTLWVHLSLGCSPKTNEEQLTSGFVVNLKEKMDSVYKLAREHLKQNSNRQKKFKTMTQEYHSTITRVEMLYIALTLQRQ